MDKAPKNDESEYEIVEEDEESESEHELEDHKDLQKSISKDKNSNMKADKGNISFHYKHKIKVSGY